MTVETIPLAADYIQKINTLVATELDPLSPATITVGSIHAGTAHNIIPPETNLQISMRTLDSKVRAFLTGRLTQTAEGLATAARTKTPLNSHGIDPMYNDEHLVATLLPLFKQIVSEQNTIELAPVMAGDDFSLYYSVGKIPAFMFLVGGTVPGTPLPWPTNHSPFFTPDFPVSFRIGLKAMVSAVIELQKSKRWTQ